jgi:hypothetical protein
MRTVFAARRDRISECSYRVLYLHWIEDRPLSAVAATLGLTRTQAWLRHHRALLGDVLRFTTGWPCHDQDQKYVNPFSG